MAELVSRITGMDMPTTRWHVGSTDLGIPYLNENGDSTIYLFGDTFRYGVGSENWRSPVALHSRSDLRAGTVVWDGTFGTGIAKQITDYRHVTDNRFGSEFTRIPNDGVSFGYGERGKGSAPAQYISFHSVCAWPENQPWRSNYSALAVSQDGGQSFDVIAGGRKNNTPQNDDPFQMVSMVKHPDGYVYFFSVRAGRQQGPMMLRRTPWNRMWDNSKYEEWGYRDGKWAWGNSCTAILYGTFGEPSARVLSDGSIVLVTLDLSGFPKIVSRTASRPDGVWSAPKTQVTAQQQPFLYGGFVHPYSSRDNLNMTVSTWGNGRYDVSHWRGTA